MAARHSLLFNAAALGSALAATALLASASLAQPHAAAGALSAPGRASVVSPAAATSAPAPGAPSADEGVALPDPSTLQHATAVQREAAMDTILAQLDAFRSGDFDKADTYQSSSLRASFDSPQSFRSLMTQVYPEFTAYDSAEFGDARASKDGRYLLLPIMLTGQDGVTVQALYLLVQESGQYRVLTVLGGMNPRPAASDDAGARMA